MKNGGHAFPRDIGWNGAQKPQKGMTLRDYFAGQALVGLLAGERAAGSYHERMVDSDTAERAYEFADAMIAERAKEGAA